MIDINTKIKNLPGFRMIAGASEDKIREAEKALNLNFAGDFRSCLSEFGAATFAGHEFTGICNSKYLNVVDATKEEWENNPNVPHHLYVVERLNIDGVVIWQSSSGEIFQSISNREINRIAASLDDYII